MIMMQLSDIHEDLYDASAVGDAAGVRELLLLGAQPHQYKDDWGVSALHEAAGGGHRDAVVSLLESGADPNTQDNDGETSLQWAVRWRHRDTVLCLLEGGADPLLPNKDGLTALQRAEAKDKEIARFVFNS